jgi:hypothetical protein
MQRDTAYDSITNGGKSGSNYRPYSGPTLLTAGSAGIMERSEATNSITNGEKSAKQWKPYAGPTLLTAGSAGIMERAPGSTSNRLMTGAEATNKIYGEADPTVRGGGGGGAGVSPGGGYGNGGQVDYRQYESDGVSESDGY